MSAVLENLSLPAIRPAKARRHRIVGLEPTARSVAHFNSVARSLAIRGQAPTLDDVASAARNLSRVYAGHAWAPGIHQRRRYLQALRMLVHEPAWRLSPEQMARIALLTDYARGEDRLVPDSLPLVGGLDTAVLLDLVWPDLVADTSAYLDFRRLRAEEALLRGERPGHFEFGREQWLEARRAEIALHAHVAMRGEESYLSRPASSLFRVH